MTRKLWLASDGTGSYEIGEGSFTIANVRDLRTEDGYKVAKAYEESTGAPFDVRATALLFRASPDLLSAAKTVLDMRESIEHETYGVLEAMAALAAAVDRAEGKA